MSGDLVHVKGLADLQKFLDELPAKVERKIMRGALRAGAKVVQDEIKATIPVRSGLLRDGIKLGGGGRAGAVIAKVKATGKHAFLAPWLEFGTRAHFIKPKDQKSLFFAGIFSQVISHPGIAPRPVFRVALDGKRTEAVMATGEYIKRRLTKEGLAAADDVELTV